MNTRLLIRLAVLTSALTVVAALVYDAWRVRSTSPPALVDAAGVDREPPRTAAPVPAPSARPVADADAARERPAPANDAQSARAKVLARRMLVGEFLAERGRLLRDPALIRALVSGDEPDLLHTLARRSEEGDAQATLALYLMNDFVCDEFATISETQNWREEIRQELEMRDETAGISMSAEQAGNYHAISAELAGIVIDLVPRCAAAAPDMASAAARLERHAVDGDGAALIAVALDNSFHREELAGRLDEFHGDELLEAIDTLGASDRCRYRALIEPRLAQGSDDDLRFAAALGRLLSANCDDAPADYDRALPLLLRGATLGESGTQRSYLNLFRAQHPEQARIEGYALQHYRRRLIDNGCLGVEHFALLSRMASEPDLIKGLHLSPYEFDAAVARSDELWEQYGGAVRRIQRCAD